MDRQARFQGFPRAGAFRAGDVPLGRAAAADLFAILSLVAAGARANRRLGLQKAPPAATAPWPAPRTEEHEETRRRLIRSQTRSAAMGKALAAATSEVREPLANPRRSCFRGLLRVVL